MGQLAINCDDHPSSEDHSMSLSGDPCPESCFGKHASEIADFLQALGKFVRGKQCKGSRALFAQCSSDLLPVVISATIDRTAKDFADATLDRFSNLRDCS